MTVGRTTRLPLFPLGTVLFPGLVLPLHIFEDRYRRLVRELLTQPEGTRRFGVVAIRLGAEAGQPEPVLYEVGCVAELRRIDPLADGRFNVVAVGGNRFRLRSVSPSRAYLVGDVEELAEEPGDPAVAGPLAERLRRMFASYLTAVSELRAAEEEPAGLPQLPEDPTALSHLVSAVALLDLADKQRLLAEPDTVSRLRSALAILGRERAVISAWQAVPAPELLHVPRGSN
ncbi:MAG: LON peptidase substrate-binding domain-containing protein [Frankiaceae bacterium]|jgi:Lon protease-like protein